jgi:membrane protein YdbS with pleckstrin-like domain
MMDRRVVASWRAGVVLLLGLPVAVPAVLGVMLAPARVGLLMSAVAVVVVGVPAVVVLPGLWFRTHRWEVTDQAVYTRSGYLRQEWRVVPLSRIQTVDTQRGLLEQCFGLATVTVTTASATGDVKIRGLAAEVAAEVAEGLTEMTAAVPGDAT